MLTCIGRQRRMGHLSRNYTIGVWQQAPRRSGVSGPTITIYSSMYSSYTCLYDMFEVSYLSLLLLPPTQLVAHLLFNVCCVRSFNLNYFFKFVLAIFLGLVFGYHMPNHLFVIRVMQMFVVIHTHTHTYLYTDKHSN